MKPPELDLLAQNIRYLRCARQWSQQRFARGGNNRSWLSRVECGKQTPSFGMVQKWAEFLDISARDLFAEDAGDWFLRELFAMKLTAEQWRTAIVIIQAAAAERLERTRKEKGEHANEETHVVAVAGGKRERATETQSSAEPASHAER